jgi:hypothetical protein
LAIARRDEDREQPTNESSLTRHGKIQPAFGFSFEEGAGDVRSAASVKAQQKSLWPSKIGTGRGDVIKDVPFKNVQDAAPTS